jgi:chemotaxis methyl-accepting protein methylase
MDDYCLIICKNVLLHFSYAQRVDVFRMFHRALAQGGYLAAGPVRPAIAMRSSTRNGKSPSRTQGQGAPLHRGHEGSDAMDSEFERF